MNTYLRKFPDGSFEAGTVTEVKPKNGWHVVHEDGESEPRNCFYVNDRAVGCVQKNLLVHKSPCVYP